MKRAGLAATSVAMCGLYGSAFLPEPGDESAARATAAIATLHHRGPDAQSVEVVDDGAALAFARLAILDLSPAGMQPMRSGSASLVFNGEIYNHHALRDELRAAGVAFRSRCDTEVILEGYRHWGDAVIERIDGMFALAIHDAERKRLLLARDRTGKKPLFYALAAGGIRFASEIKALVAAGVPAEVDVAALPHLLAMGYVPPPGTMYRGVQQLPPAHTLVLTPGSAPEVKRYWRAPFAAPPLEVPLAEATARVRELTLAAVERRLEADVPLGAFLSGGVDSTLIVGAMAQKVAKVKTFSIGFSGDERYDETRYARLVAQRFGTDHTEFRVEPSAFDVVEELVRVHDGPFGDSSAIPTSIVSRLTREHVTVALTGDGGDELFCGYTRFLAAEAAERIPAPLLQLGMRAAQRFSAGQSERGLGARARRFFAKSALPLDQRLFGWMAFFPDQTTLLRPELAATLDLAAPLAWNRKVLDRAAAATPLARILEHNFETYLPYDLLVKADRSSMLHSLELRSPFLDTALVDYVARLPDGYKRRGTTTKWILKHAFPDLVPREIRTRGKMGFGVPLGAWFRADLKSYVQDRFAEGELYDYLDRGAVQALLADHFAGRADHGQRLWLLLTLEIWLRGLRQPSAPSSRAISG